MNNFAEIILVRKYNKITYYTISINEDTSLFRQFVTKHTIKHQDKLQHIMSWIKILGNKYGAYEKYFRNEAETADARALPPKGKNRKPTYVEIDKETKQPITRPNSLRLYCMRANDSVVFLYNGDIKTAELAQNCENVRPHFKLANKLTELIDKAFKDRTIQWNEEFTDIIVEDDFRLEWD